MTFRSTLVSIFILPLLLAGCATENFSGESNSVTVVELMPHSAVRITAWGSCATITNRFSKPTIVPVPVYYADAWRSFTTRKHDPDHISLSPCTD